MRQVDLTDEEKAVLRNFLTGINGYEMMVVLGKSYQDDSTVEKARITLTRIIPKLVGGLAEEGGE